MSTPTPRERFADTEESPAAALLGAWPRIERALQEIATFETDDADVIGLLLHLTAILDGPAPLADPAETPYPLTAELIRQRLADALTGNWPRMAHADHAGDVADSLAEVVLPIVSRLRHESSVWRGKAVQALTQRDRARATAVTLEQITAEAARLLRAGLPGRALAVLESDGWPLGPCAAPGHAEYEAAHEDTFAPDNGRDLDGEE